MHKFRACAFCMRLYTEGCRRTTAPAKVRPAPGEERAILITILRNCDVYAPERIGRKDILLAGGRIAAVEDAIAHPGWPHVDEIDCGEAPVVPGFIDSHVHILGGGGSNGPHTRGPELQLSDFTSTGITTAVGLLGADGITRDLRGLIAKARALAYEGLSTFVFLGAYDVPPPTITGDRKLDLFLVELALGVGEIAISDVRSSQPTAQELARIAADAAIAGRLTGRGGVVNVHVGPGKRGLELLFDVVESTDLPPATFLPTHCNRTGPLLEQAARWGRAGGPVDLTTHRAIPGMVWCPEAVPFLLNKGVPLENISMSTDAGGVYPHLTDDQGRPAMVRWETHLLHDELVALVESGMDLEQAVRLVTANPARHLRLYPRKGVIRPGADADLVVLNGDFTIDKVVAGGRLMVTDGKPIATGTFETSHR
ncbi:MAG TPA: beta-aspartyl-peptidase [Bacillota bacterium]